MTEVRLQKFLASAGVSSRRKAEELISAGRVKVNGRVVSEPGTKVDDAKDTVVVNGKTIKPAETTWIALHKPRGYVSTRKDPQGRPTVYDLLPAPLHSLFYVGRLDLDSEGLLLLTNDGDTAHRLLHPRYEVERVYEVLVRGEIKPDKLAQLLTGVELDDGVATAESVKVLGVVRNEMRLRLTLREGKKREVRRMLWAVGHKVLRLKRISYGPIKLNRLPEGKWRKLSEDELRSLRPGSATKRRNETAQRKTATKQRDDVAPRARITKRRYKKAPRKGAANPRNEPARSKGGMKSGRRPGQPVRGPVGRAPSKRTKR